MSCGGIGSTRLRENCDTRTEGRPPSDGDTVPRERRPLGGACGLLISRDAARPWMLVTTSALPATSAALGRGGIRNRALARAPAVQLVTLCSQRDWARERGLSATEQILPLIRKGHGRKNRSQSATGLDIANNFSLWFREDLCQGFFQARTASMVSPLSLKNWQQ